MLLHNKHAIVLEGSGYPRNGNYLCIYAQCNFHGVVRNCTQNLLLAFMVCVVISTITIIIIETNNWLQEITT